LNNYEKQVNFARFQPGQKAGHDESFFQHANHPTRPIAFWYRVAFKILTDARDHGIEIRV
jgi:hypothetical protein